MMEKPSKLVPALIGGAVLGILSSIPFVNLANCCFCFWVLLGGAIAAKLLISRSPVYPVQTGEGAAVGALAGLVGCSITLVVGIPLSILFGSGMTASIMSGLRGLSSDPNFTAQMDQALRQSQSRPMAEALGYSLFYWVVGSLVSIGFATLGGLIGVSLFEKRKGPPQGFGPPPQGNFPGAPYGGGGPY
ncbi:MAG TPA: hypothetical protein VJX67_11625 [Blastocatellia bacterium]|nr:hypothetical protein [Blastocatellia bacterium]